MIYLNVKAMIPLRECFPCMSSTNQNIQNNITLRHVQPKDFGLIFPPLDLILIIDIALEALMNPHVTLLNGGE